MVGQRDVVAEYLRLFGVVVKETNNRLWSFRETADSGVPGAHLLSEVSRIQVPTSPLNKALSAPRSQ